MRARDKHYRFIMYNNLKMRYLIAAMLCIGAVHAQEQLDEVVVSDTRIPKPRKNSGKAVVQISAEEIAKNKGISLAQLLNQYAGCLCTHLVCFFNQFLQQSCSFTSKKPRVTCK